MDSLQAEIEKAGQVASRQSLWRDIGKNGQISGCSTNHGNHRSAHPNLADRDHQQTYSN